MRYLFNETERTYLHLEKHLPLISIIGCILLPISYLTELHVPMTYDTWHLRTFTTAVLIPFLLPAFFRAPEGLVIAWTNCVLVWCLSTVWTAFLMLNAATTPPETHIHTLWIVEYLTGAFLFVAMVRSYFIVITGSAFSLAFITTWLLFLPDVNWGEVFRVVPYAMAALVTALTVNALNNNNLNRLETSQRRSLLNQVTRLGHDLKESLVNLNRELVASRDSFEAIATASANGPLTTRQRSLVASTPDDLQVEINSGVDVVNTLLNTLTDPFALVADKEDFNISECISKAVDRFPYASDLQRDIVDLRVTQDFTVCGKRVVVENIVANLLKNALYYVEKGDGDTIAIEVDGAQRKLSVWDNGTGITKTDLSRVFDIFYTTTESGSGSGIGLSFCKIAMEAHGGSITCESEPGRYTRFACQFP